MQITLTPEQIAAVVQQAVGGSGSTPTVAQPAVAHGGVTFLRDPSGRRIDDVMPSGTPGTITLPVTGHVLSLPQPTYGPDGKVSQGGELIMGYAYRTQRQTGGGATVAQTLGALALMQSGLKTYGDTPGHWPFMVDEFYNRALYNPVDPAEAARTAKAWADEQDRLRQQAPASTVPTGDGALVITEGTGNAP